MTDTETATINMLASVLANLITGALWAVPLWATGTAEYLPTMLCLSITGMVWTASIKLLFKGKQS